MQNTSLVQKITFNVTIGRIVRLQEATQFAKFARNYVEEGDPDDGMERRSSVPGGA
jgi:hypothetical protein